jgi:hypothetical protein
MGILQERLLADGKISDETDEKFRNRIASQCAAYETLRDAAFALKHSELTGSRDLYAGPINCKLTVLPLTRRCLIEALSKRKT